jgi:hypothetical protein
MVASPAAAAERVGRHHELNAPVEEPAEQRAAGAGWKRGMVRGRGTAIAPEDGGEPIGAVPRRDIDDRRALRRAEPGHGPTRAFRLVATHVYSEGQIGAIEALPDGHGAREAEDPHDIGSGGRGGCRRERDRGRRAQLLPVSADRAVVWPELVPPLADAVRLVHGEQARVEAHPVEHALESLGRHVEQLESAGPERVPHRASHLGLLGAAQVRGGDAPAPERRHLVLHQRDQRRDHEREPREQQRRHLEAERLPASGGQDGETITPAQRREHDAPLVEAEAGVAPDLLEHGFGPVEGAGGVHGNA